MARRTYKPGSFLRVDDRTGFTVYAENTKKEWQGLIVSKETWEPRHPQDFVRGKADKQTVPDPRPGGADTFSGPKHYAMDDNAAAQATVIPLEETTGLAATHRIGLVLDTGDVHRTTIVSVSSGVSVTLTLAIPSKASTGNILTDYDA